jgi:SAM-dependent methyltransferase
MSLPRPVDPAIADLNEKALAALAGGDVEDANEAAERAADAGSLLGVALSTYLRTAHRHDVYHRPAAFEAFIAGGGNVELYLRTSATLASAYLPGMAVLDIGCGNGRALVPALQAAGVNLPAAVDLVEPGADLLRHCVEAITTAALPIRTVGWQVGLTDFLRAAPPTQRWHLAQSTFALQSIEPTERAAALTALAPRVDRLIVVDFDMPDHRVGSRSRLRSLAVRYEQGLAEYDEDRDLVAQGFLMPVLAGQLSADTPRTNWEHPVDEWIDQVSAAGFSDVQTQRVADYWSGPAFVLVAKGQPL